MRSARSVPSSAAEELLNLFLHYALDAPTLSPALPNAGSVLKGLGYKTAYFGKFEMDKKILEPKPTVIYSTVAQPYGFDVFGAGGDIGSAPRDDFNNDPFIAGESIRWLRETVKPAVQLRPLFWLLQWRRSVERSAGTIRRHPSSA